MAQEIQITSDSPALGQMDSEGAITRSPSVDVFGKPISRMVTTLRLKGNCFVVLPANCPEIKVSVVQPSPVQEVPEVSEVEVPSPFKLKKG
jgi:hypothetical protein